MSGRYALLELAKWHAIVASHAAKEADSEVAAEWDHSRAIRHAAVAQALLAIEAAEVAADYPSPIDQPVSDAASEDATAALTLLQDLVRLGWLSVAEPTPGGSEFASTWLTLRQGTLRLTDDEAEFVRGLTGSRAAG